MSHFFSAHKLSNMYFYSLDSLLLVFVFLILLIVFSTFLFSSPWLEGACYLLEYDFHGSVATNLCTKMRRCSNFPIAHGITNRFLLLENKHFLDSWSPWFLGIMSSNKPNLDDSKRPVVFRCWKLNPEISTTDRGMSELWIEPQIVKFAIFGQGCDNISTM